MMTISVGALMRALQEPARAATPTLWPEDRGLPVAAVGGPGQPGGAVGEGCGLERRNPAGHAPSPERASSMTRVAPNCTQVTGTMDPTFMK